VWGLGLAAATLISGCYSSSGTQVASPCTLTPPATGWRLVADGTALRDSAGRAVFLRGVNAGGRSKFAPYLPFDFAPGQYAQSLGAYMDRAASWGIDAMRVPFTWAALEGTQGTYDTAWLAQYQQLLAAAWARGIWTVVDFHQDIYSESYCGDGFPSWTIADAPPASHDCPQWQLEYFNNPGVKAAFDAFWANQTPTQAQFYAAWTVMIAALKDQAGVVGFEPINEPAAGSQNESEFEATTLSTFFSTAVPFFRGLAPQSLVFVDAPGVDGAESTTSLKKPAGGGIVFAPHYYPVASGENLSIVLPGLQGWAQMGAAWNVPVFVGEFGLSHASDNALPFMTAHLQALDTLGLGGSEWEYSVSADAWNEETDGVVAADGTEYPVASALIRPFARAVAGDAITQSWDPDATVFTLSYTPSSSASTSVTEVQLPKRAYRSLGYTISLTSGCYDATSVPGRLLIQPGPAATQVTLEVRGL
jgi:endoglycosylceramidase